MKRILFILSFISFNVLVAQGNKAFSRFNIGFYCGINFYNPNSIRGDLLGEINTSLISSFKLRLSTGYFKEIQPYSYTVMRYYENNSIDTIPVFFATKYNLISKNYDVFPFTLGIQYNFICDILSPYIMIDAVYNIINASIKTSPPETWSYSSIDEVPDEFKREHRSEKLPGHSYGIILGVGTLYYILPQLSLNIRYFFKYDSEIVNTHHIIIGINL